MSVPRLRMFAAHNPPGKILLGSAPLCDLCAFGELSRTGFAVGFRPFLDLPPALFPKKPVLWPCHWSTDS